MGLRPCFRCKRRYVGKANHVYPAVMDEPESWRDKFSLCANCYRSYMDWVRLQLTVVNEDGYVDEMDDSNMDCAECGERPLASIAVFVTTYPSKNERVDYMGYVCSTCADAVIMRLGAAQMEMPQTAT